MVKRVVLMSYLILAYFASFFIISEAAGLIGVPTTINQEVVLHSGQTFDRLFLLSSVSKKGAVFYTVNNRQKYELSPDSTITVYASSDFDGSIHVDKIGKNNVRLHFDLHRDHTVNFVIGLVAIFLVIPFYWVYTKVVDMFITRKESRTE